MCYHNVLVISTYAGMLHAGRQLPYYAIVLCPSQNIRFGSSFARLCWRFDLSKPF